MGVGDSLYEKIDSGITACKVVISCVTEKYALSLNCRREVSLADGREKPIIPILLENTAWPPSGPMSMVLTQLKYIDFSQQTDLTEGKNFATLLERLAQHVGKPGEAKPKQVASNPPTAVAAQEKPKNQNVAQNPSNGQNVPQAKPKDQNPAPAKPVEQSQSKSCSIL